ncbi:enoyl-CoA hydratase/isomerase family protein [Crossiella sp. SN42]|uniref:enoyl-CoA hydratase/isomerase family protein n=1 Tax=Crossiella sp. SN42 TaxID=2944808 RepID=UPI00207CD087|nr:enoyl-CoA hydratase/isomerase family protein [Crossiella sp. SN42]MCO1575092.1 enoyl-CoA hydratase/isomerase family protein [Crossiella sp. SN42]
MNGIVEVSVRTEVAVLRLNRPEKLNALNRDMRRELAARIRGLGEGDRVRGLVITGAGRAFSAGMDLVEAESSPPGGLLAEVSLFHDLTRAVLDTRMPVVAAVNGVAVGGAGEFTFCCDARIGSPSAEFVLPENAVGLTVSNAASVLLPRLVGGRALRLVLDSSRIGAERALELGLLDEIVPQERLLDAAVRLVRRWTEPGSATEAHLALLRPSRAELEAAFERETAAVRATEENGTARAGLARALAGRAAVSR